MISQQKLYNMAMTSSTWRFDTQSTLVGCGVDIEAVDRFEGLAPDDPHPMPFVFSSKEIAHARKHAKPAPYYCLSFTCKEALFKAIGKPYEYKECEILPELEKRASFIESDITLSPRLKKEINAERVHFRSILRDTPRMEIISQVYLFRGVNG